MNKTDATRFKKLWISACKALRGDVPDDDALSLIFVTLGDLPMSDIEKALSYRLKTSDFTPTAKFVLEFINGSFQDRAMLAWNKVQKVYRRSGNLVNVDFGDPCVHFAIESMGGWHKWGVWDRSEETWKRKDFISYYILAVEHGKQWSLESPRVLRGIFFLSNRGNRKYFGEETLGEMDKVYLADGQTCSMIDYPDAIKMLEE